MAAIKIYPIGTVLYVVNKALKVSAKVLPARVKGYQNINGTVYPILNLVGVSGNVKEVSPQHNNIFDNLEDAVQSIQTPK